MWERNAIIIPGAQKSGTTTLFKMLAQHSRVRRPRLKEPHFFILSQAEIAAKSSWYQKLFPEEGAGEGRWLLDASASYLSGPAAPAKIKAHFAAVRVVVLLRDPAQRAYSGYLHMRTKAPPAERRDFEAILAEVAEATPRTGSVPQAEDEALRRAAKRGEVDATYFDEGYHGRFYGEAGAAVRTTVDDPLFLYRYFQMSMYRAQVERYACAFGAENVKVLFFENLIADPEETMRGILDFLDLPPEPRALRLVHGNKTHPPRGALKERLLALRRGPARTGVDALISALENVGLGRAVRAAERFVSKPPPKPELSRAGYERARALLADEYAYWLGRHAELDRLWRY